MAQIAAKTGTALVLYAALLMGSFVPVPALKFLGNSDALCKTGILSIGNDPAASAACCPMYCGECSDYGAGLVMDTPTCSNIRGQNSTGSCCKSAVLQRECGKGATAADCIPSCSESTPPCILSSQQANEARLLTPPGRQASDDCGSALKTWRHNAEAARVSANMATTEAPTTEDPETTAAPTTAAPTTAPATPAPTPACTWTKRNHLWPAPITGGGGKDGRWNYCDSSFIGGCSASWTSQTCSSDSACFTAAQAQCTTMDNCVAITKDGYGYNLRLAGSDHGWAGESWEKSCSQD